MTESLVEALSPELVLVCPELRSIALAMLPERDPDAFLPGLETNGDAQLPEGSGPGGVVPETKEGPRDTDQHVLVAALRYVVGQSISVALHGVVVIAVVTSLLALAEIIQR